jgi:YVTN family beta-propeller protein
MKYPLILKDPRSLDRPGPMGLSRPRRTALALVVLSIFSLFTGLFTAGADHNLKDRLAGAAKTRTAPTGSGLLYVVDPNNMQSESRVLVVDPEQGRIVRTYNVGHAPDIALSPDGTRLYIASVLNTSSGRGTPVLEVFDTATGRVIQTVRNRDAWVSTLREYPSHMAFSPDGHFLFIYKIRVLEEGDYFDYLETFDTRTSRFLREKAPVPHCISANLIPLQDGRVSATCTGTNDVRFLELTSTGGLKPASKDSSARLPSRVALVTSKSKAFHTNRIGPAFVSADGRGLTAIMGDGKFFRIDDASRSIFQAGTIDSESRAAASGGDTSAPDWLSESWIRQQEPAVSPDGTTLYLAIGRLSRLYLADQSFDRIVALDSALNRVGTITLGHPFFSMAMSKDGRRLYAISPEQASVTVVDTATQRVVRTIYGIGTSPTLVIPAP